MSALHAAVALTKEISTTFPNIINESPAYGKGVDQRKMLVIHQKQQRNRDFE